MDFSLPQTRRRGVAGLEHLLAPRQVPIRRFLHDGAQGELDLPGGQWGAGRAVEFAYPGEGKAPYDIASAHLILRRLGGRAGRLGGDGIGVVETVDCVVIGAGVVGLAVARALARGGRETIILERAPTIGTGISSRNSEVIHAGIYYPRGSLKARLCVAGRDLLYDYCATHGVEHRRCGKLIVATTPEQLAELDRLDTAARANGVADLVRLDAAEARRLEPEIACVGALLSPSTGIIDSHGFMLSLLGEAEALGAMIACGTAVTALTPRHDGTDLSIDGAEEPALRARIVVNAAGLQACALAARVRGLAEDHIPRLFLAKGNYFTLSGRAPFSRLVYPVPEPGGLGVHVTIDLAGQIRFGPDVEWIEAEDYDVDPRRAARFYAAIRAYWPGLPDGALQPGYAGIRPKLSGPGEAAADFRIAGPAEHGVAGLINLFGIESPGLTASLALADEVVALAG
jgi:L-2-hydroxyglutarate oxidase LhgO